MIKMMTKNQPPRTAIDQDRAIVRALSSITPQQADTIVQAMRGVEPTWEVQTFDDYDGYRSLLIEPTFQGDKQNAFFITGTAKRLELCEAHGDDLTPLADFSNVDDLSARLFNLISQQ
jgi:hypothetical protein